MRFAIARPGRVGIGLMRVCLSLAMALSLVVVRQLPVAANEAMYTVSGVPVDVTADSAIAARTQAVEQGQREGLRLLLRRLTSPEDEFRLPDVSTVDLAPVVRSFGVENEQLSADRYIGEVETSFDPDAVRDLLRGRDVPIVLEGGPPLLVVPAQRIAGSLRLFERNDPWTVAWGENFARNTLLEVILPLGDLMDMSQLRAGGDRFDLQAGLQAMALRYDADAAVLLVAEGDPETDPRIAVTQEAAWNWPEGFGSVSVTPTDEPDKDWALAVERSLVRLEEPWKAENLVFFDQVEQLEVTAPLVDLNSWAHIRRVLAGAPEVTAVQVVAFSQTETQLMVRFVGGLAQLQRSLENRGLGLAEGTGAWLLLPAANPQDG